MKKILFITSILALLLIIGVALADTEEPCDNCSGETIWLVIRNDMDYHTDLSPSSSSTDLSCCPFWTTPEEHLEFPDTIPYAKTIDSLVELSEVDDSDPDSILATDWWHKDVLTGSFIQIPPHYTTCCCDKGIYWKARMRDSNTSAWSAWFDITMIGHTMVAAGPLLLIGINTDAIKTADYTANLEFNCDVDTIVVYVWDCENEVGGDETQGEFGVIYRTFPDPAMMGGSLKDTVWLQRYQGSIGIGDNQPKLPADYFISQNTPNPFNATTAIQYGIPEDAEVHVEITNILGQKVATLVDEHQTAGYKRLIWNGRDDMGRELSSGVYFYSIKANGFMDKKRAILMK